MNDNTRHNVNESSDKIRLNLKLTRGTGTRDQEAHTLKIRAANPEQAADRADRVIDELSDRDVFDRARNVQPDADPDDD